jgi:hypothetical protein
MKKTPEILCFGLPEGVLGALREQSPENWRFEAILGDPDLILCLPGQEARIPENLKCATPLLSFGKRPEKIGGLFRRLHQMLEEPSIFIADFRIGGYVFSAQEKTLRRDNGEEIDLTDREVDILFYLARQKNRTVGKNDLLKNVWKYQDNIDTHTLETHIYRLRQKMERDNENPVLLVTEEGGYRLVLPQA